MNNHIVLPEKIPVKTLPECIFPNVNRQWLKKYQWNLFRRAKMQQNTHLVHM